MEFSKVIKWKRFSHSPYAVFCSIHKVINIGVLSVAVIANADAKSNKEQEPEENPAYYEMLDDVEVTAEQEGISINGPDIFSYKMELQNIQTAPQQSVNDLLKQVPEIDVRQRGANGIQTDISIKGATLYTTFSPCLLCAKMIINGGIAEVVFNEHYSIDGTARRILQEAGVILRALPGKEDKPQ